MSAKSWFSARCRLKFGLKQCLASVPLLLGGCVLGQPQPKVSPPPASSAPTKEVYTRFAVVADPHNNNDNLKKALNRAKEEGVEYVVGLGDYTQVGTVGELQAVKDVFDGSGLLYFVLPGDHDLWDSRNQGQEPTTNFLTVFGVVIEPALQTSYDFGFKGVGHLMVDNSDFYLGIAPDEWSWLENVLNQDRQLTGTQQSRLPRFLFLHQALDHPVLSHLMGRLSEDVNKQRLKLLELIAGKGVDEVFSGDLHLFSRFTQPDTGVKMTTVGALSETRNPEPPSFVLVTVYSDGTYQVEKVEI